MRARRVPRRRAGRASRASISVSPLSTATAAAPAPTRRRGPRSTAPFSKRDSAAAARYSPASVIKPGGPLLNGGGAPRGASGLVSNESRARGRAGARRLFAIAAARRAAPSARSPPRRALVEVGTPAAGGVLKPQKMPRGPASLIGTAARVLLKRLVCENCRFVSGTHQQHVKLCAAAGGRAASQIRRRAPRALFSYSTRPPQAPSAPY